MLMTFDKYEELNLTSYSDKNLKKLVLTEPLHLLKMCGTSIVMEPFIKFKIGKFVYTPCKRKLVVFDKYSVFIIISNGFWDWFWSFIVFWLALRVSFDYYFFFK